MIVERKLHRDEGHRSLAQNPIMNDLGARQHQSSTVREDSKRSEA